MAGFLTDLATYAIFGKPLVVYGGAITLVALLVTAYLGYQMTQGKAKLETHKTAAIIAVVLGVAHAILAISMFF